MSSGKKRYDACTPRPKYGGGTWWHRVGTAIENDKGQITLFLDSYPMPDKERGSAVIMLFEPRERDEKESTETRRPAKDSKKRDDVDDEIPF